MLEKHVVDPQKADKQNIIELANKLNEVINLISRDPRSATPSPPSKMQYVEYLEKIIQRVRSGPLTFISQEEPNDLTKAMEDALSVFQTAVTAYKESITPEVINGG